MFVFGFRTTGRQLTSAAMVSRKGNARNVASCSDLGFRFPVLIGGLLGAQAKRQNHELLNIVCNDSYKI